MKDKSIPIVRKRKWDSYKKNLWVDREFCINIFTLLPNARWRKVPTNLIIVQT